MERQAAIILIGGSGQRFGHTLPKQFHRLSGKRVYEHTLEPFQKTGIFDQIILVCHPDHMGLIDQKDAILVPGGATRQESVYNGLQACNCDIVVIHDGARPFVTEEIILANVAAAKKHGAVDTCIPSRDTLVQTVSGHTIDEIPERSHLLRGQTPQSFSFPLICKAHEKARSEGITDATDDCRLVHRLGHEVHIVTGSDDNLKITSTLDLFIAEQLLRQRLRKPKGHGSLEGQVFAITGGTGGIGQALIRQLEEEGATALALSRSSKEYPVDLCSYDETAKIFAKIQEKYGKIDGLINGVGKMLIKPIENLSKTEIDELIQTNLTAYVHACRHAPLKEGGSIINIASSSYSRGRKDYALYSATKAAVVNFTQGLADEMPHLRINALVPSRMDTQMRHQHFEEHQNKDLLDPSIVAGDLIDVLKDQTLTGSIIEVKKI